MIFQVRSYKDLCASKKYLTKEEINDHIKAVVKATEKHRLGLSEEERRKIRHGSKVTTSELEESIEILRIDDDHVCHPISALGTEMEIRKPIDIIELEAAKKKEARAKREAML